MLKQGIFIRKPNIGWLKVYCNNLQKTTHPKTLDIMKYHKLPQSSDM